MRLRPEIYEALRKDAERNSRSIAAEAERRLLQPELNASDVGRLVSIAVKGVERRLGKAWSEDDAVKRQCRAAAELILDALLGESANLAELRAASDREADLKKQFPQESLRSLVHLLSGVPQPDSEVVTETLRDWQQGRDEAVRMLCSVWKAKP